MMYLVKFLFSFPFPLLFPFLFVIPICHSYLPFPLLFPFLFVIPICHSHCCSHSYCHFIAIVLPILTLLIAILLPLRSPSIMDRCCTSE